MGILGGLGEFGMNCLVLETDEEMVMIDCGHQFTDSRDFGVEVVIPNFDYVLERKDKLKALLLTHGHEDHFGGVAYLLQAGIFPDIYVTGFTRYILEARLKERGYISRATILDYPKPGVWQQGSSLDFRWQTFPVNHSIVDSMALVVDTPAGRIFHTGDFRFDENPVFGKPLEISALENLAQEYPIDLLLSDSTNVEVESAPISESTIEPEFESRIRESQGLSIVTFPRPVPALFKIDIPCKPVRWITKSYNGASTGSR